MIIIFITIIVIVIIEAVYSPRIEKLVNGEYVLWYSAKGGRKYLIF